MSLLKQFTVILRIVVICEQEESNNTFWDSFQRIGRTDEGFIERGLQNLKEHK